MAVQNNPTQFQLSVETHFLNSGETKCFLISALVVGIALITTLILGILGTLSAHNLLPPCTIPISPEVAYSMLAAALGLIVASTIVLVKIFRSKAQLESKTENIVTQLQDPNSVVSQNTVLKQDIEASDGIVSYHYDNIWIVYQKSEAQFHTFPNAQDQLQFLQEARDRVK